MNSRKEFLRRLLHNDNWSRTEKELLLHYLEEGDISELEELARAEYNSGLNNSRNVLSRQLSGAILQNIHQQIGIIKHQEVVQPAKVKFFNLYRLTAAAAVLIIMAGIGFIKRDAIINMLFPVKMQQVYTAANQVKTVNLADGSVVQVQGNSVLSFPEKFTGTTRDVNLKGEAFFKVAKDHQHPFIVHSPLVNTTVVGTEFNVVDQDSINAKVVVVSGIVKVHTADNFAKQEVKLLPTDAAVFGMANKLLGKINSPDDARFYRQRRDGKFVYNGVPVANVIKDIERFYKTAVTIDDKMANRAFYGNFKTGDDIATVLKIMAISMNAVVHETDNKKGYALSCGSCE